MKFKQLAEKWLETVYISHSIATYNRYYEFLIWYLYPEFENSQVHKIKQQQFADFYIKMQTKVSKITHRPYSESTISNIHTILYEIMKFGRDKLIQHCLFMDLELVKFAAYNGAISILKTSSFTFEEQLLLSGILSRTKPLFMLENLKQKLPSEQSQLMTQSLKFLNF